MEPVLVFPEFSFFLKLSRHSVYLNLYTYIVYYMSDLGGDSLFMLGKKFFFFFFVKARFHP